MVAHTGRLVSCVECTEGLRKRFGAVEVVANVERANSGEGLASGGRAVQHATRKEDAIAASPARVSVATSRRRKEVRRRMESYIEASNELSLTQG
jgi:hypothetical protein